MQSKNCDNCKIETEYELQSTCTIWVCAIVSRQPMTQELRDMFFQQMQD